MDFSVHGGQFVEQFLATQAIPSTKLLIKYHKTINNKWGFPTRFVIPAMKFTMTFSKIGYLEIKIILYKSNVNYSRVSIVQVSDLKEGLEELEIKIDVVKIASVDYFKMYPSIKLATIRKAVIFFSRKLTAATNKTINICLEIIRFGISSTLISFNMKY